ncbi:MAG TPA: alpha-glucosidase [Candidatus Limnocylindrales bacterium]|nr:alpha-glucosidase [Candidatus Limnocylindrales bacterium]
MPPRPPVAATQTGDAGLVAAGVRLADAPPAPTWWHEAVFYQIYPRSFADGNGDGIGDFVGMTARLDYLADLGIDALWISPHYPSPLRDLGYDISDYLTVDPQYGSLDDFRGFLDGAHARGIRVILDLVLNHTSDQHPWFAESRLSATNTKRDWYLWRDGRDGGPPNNWMSQFGGSAWQLDPATGQYYYHAFLVDQPDLNWRHPELREAMWQAVRFWLDLGVDGFRLDAIGNLFKAPELPDHVSARSVFELWWAWQTATSDEERSATTAGLTELFRHQLDQPEVHELMRELRRLVSAYPDRVLVGETDRVEFYGHDDELNLTFNFPLMQTDRLTASWIRRNQTRQWTELPPGAWPATTLGNHDTSRIRSRFSAGDDDLARARLAAAVVLTLPGTPFLYYGEEIGMTDFLLEDVEQFRDAWGLWFHRSAEAELGLSAPEALVISSRFGRDKSRTPMQWTNAANAGFSPEGAATWLPTNPNHRSGVNVAEQLTDAGSLLRFYRRLLRVRRRTPALRRGDLTMLVGSDDVLAFVRRSLPDHQACLVVLNLSDRPQRLRLDVGTDALDTLFSTRSQRGVIERPTDLRMAAHEIYIAELE